MIINGKEYTPTEMNFATVCKMEKLGAPITDFEERPLSAVAAYAAVSMKRPLEYAAAEIEQHIIGGGDLEEIMTCFKESLEESGFFQALAKGKETKAKA